jgi:methoxymalonate biosynthesis protein
VSTPRPEHRLAVLGAGTMGAGIAALALGRGLDVLLVDVDDGTLAAARTRVTAALRLARLMGSLPRVDGTGGAAAGGELRTSTAVADVAGCTAVVESVVERAEVKATVLAEASAAVEPGTLVVSNTSAIPIDELAGATRSPADVVGVHFMNPPYLIRTVEVIRGPRTGEAAMAAVAVLLAALDREPVVVGDGPGFVINRILQRMINEAARVVAEGVATPEAVDALFTGCLGHRTGPLATADLIGLDNVVDSLVVLHERTGDEGYRPAALLVRKVRAGELGRKSGHGFFEHGSPL